MENLKSYQSAYASLTAEITANLSRIGQNLKLDALPEDSIGIMTLKFYNQAFRFILILNFVKVDLNSHTH